MCPFCPVCSNPNTCSCGYLVDNVDEPSTDLSTGLTTVRQRTRISSLFSLWNLVIGATLTFDVNSLATKFYVKLPGSSKKSKTIGAEVPVDIYRWLEEIAASKEYPEYKTRSDVIRDTMYLGLLIRTDPRFRDVEELQALRSGIEAKDQYDRIQEMRTMVDELVFNLSTTNPHDDAALKLLEKSSGFLDAITNPSDKERLGQAIDRFRKGIE